MGQMFCMGWKRGGGRVSAGLEGGPVLPVRYARAPIGDLERLVCARGVVFATLELKVEETSGKECRIVHEEAAEGHSNVIGGIVAID